MSRRKKHKKGRRGTSFASRAITESCLQARNKKRDFKELVNQPKERIVYVDQPAGEPDAMRYPDAKKQLIEDVKALARHVSDYTYGFDDEHERDYFQARIGGYNDALDDIIELLLKEL
jgi:hypothetical protein